MKTALVALTAAGLVAAQNIPGMPGCAVPCLRDSIPQLGCNPNDIGCMCRDDNPRKLMTTVASCVASKCNPNEWAQVQSTCAAACAQAGHPIGPGGPGAPGGPAIPGAPGGPGYPGGPNGQGYPGAPGAPAGAQGWTGTPAGSQGWAPGAPGAQGYPGAPGAPGAQGYPGGPGAPGAPGAPDYHGPDGTSVIAGSTYVSGSLIGGGHPWSTQTNPGLYPTPGASRSWDDDDYSSSSWNPTATWSSQASLITSVFATAPNGSLVPTATLTNAIASSTFGSHNGVATGAAPGGPAAGALAALLAVAMAL